MSHIELPQIRLSSSIHRDKVWLLFNNSCSLERLSLFFPQRMTYSRRFAICIFFRRLLQFDVKKNPMLKLNKNIIRRPIRVALQYVFFRRLLQFDVKKKSHVEAQQEHYF